MAAELLPCPFCGGQAEEHQLCDYNDTSVIECQGCGARSDLGDTALLARKSWNRRLKSLGGVSALQTANSRYVTALGVLQDFYEWAGRVEPNGFETWCKQRLNAANRAALHT